MILGSLIQSRYFIGYRRVFRLHVKPLCCDQPESAIVIREGSLKELLIWHYSWLDIVNMQLNTLRSRQHGRYFADDTFKCIFLNDNIRISIKSSLKFVPRGPINNIRALVQIMAWHRLDDKPSSEPMVVRSPTHICVSMS